MAVQRNPSWRSAARGSRAAEAAVRRLGRTVRTLRGEAGLTQEEAAARAALDPKHWQDLEAGRTNPTVATLVAVAKALGVTLPDLFDGA